MTNHTLTIGGVKFCRVSSREQEETGYSLDAQDKVLSEYAEKNRIDIRKAFRISESASGKQERKTFSEMMTYVRRNRVRNIIVETTDRLTRNFADVPDIDKWVMGDERNQIHLVKEGCILHKNSKSHEWFMWRVKVATAEYYVRLLSENVKKGQKQKIAEGWLPSRPRLGYKSVGEKRHKKHVPHPAIARHIRSAFEYYNSGDYSLKRLEHLLYDAGLRGQNGGRLHASRIHRLLSDPFYCGFMRWKGQIYPGKHEPLVSKRLFDSVQKKLKRPTKTPYYVKHNPVFKGKIRCLHCDGLVTWYLKKGNFYGHCYNHGASRKCSHKTCMRQERVEEQLFPIFECIAPKNEAMLQYISAVQKDMRAEAQKGDEREHLRLEKLLVKARKSREKYYEAKINREVPAEYCDQKIAELNTEEAMLESSLANATTADEEKQEAQRLLYQLAFQVAEIYQRGTTEEKQDLLAILFTNFKQDGRKIIVEYTPAGAHLMKWMPRLNQHYELHKTRIKYDSNGEILSPYPVLLAWQCELRNLDWMEIFPVPEWTINLVRKMLRPE
ncbi:recombinase family protein [Kordiimonas pumila]|nr:recombinase family protein [Kordiimonas pumila]